MNKRVLLAWELGGGGGHVVAMTAIAAALRTRGYEPIFAVHRLDAVASLIAGGRGDEFFQAPVWPNLLVGALSAGLDVAAAGLGDTLADIGLSDSAVVESMIGVWERLFAQIRPAAVIAEFAPACLLAAGGRIPTAAVGTGYALPPADASAFPILRPDQDKRKHDEGRVLGAVNRALGRLGRTQLGALPAIFAADRACVACFAEFDPYADLRSGPYAPPFLPRWERTPAAGGKEIFVYLNEGANFNPIIFPAIEQVALTGTPVRMVALKLPPAVAARLSAAGAQIENAPLKLDEIARRAALIVFHGGLGTASFALASGIPQIVVAFDTEKWLTGRAVERLGAGRCLRLARDNPLEAALLAQVILEAYADQKLAAAARKLAPEFAARLEEDPAEIVTRQVVELVESV